MSVEVGDMACLVWACCPLGRRHIGWVGIVEGLDVFDGSPCFCGEKTHGVHAWIDIGGKGVVPVSWLIKIPPVADPMVSQQSEREST